MMAEGKSGGRQAADWRTLIGEVDIDAYAGGILGLSGPGRYSV